MGWGCALASVTVFSQVCAMGYVHRYLKTRADLSQKPLPTRSLLISCNGSCFPRSSPSGFFFFSVSYLNIFMWWGFSGRLFFWGTDGMCENMMPSSGNRVSQATAAWNPARSSFTLPRQWVWQPALISVLLHLDCCWYSNSLVWGLRGCFCTMQKLIFSTPWPSPLCF